jgi:2-polyprenyl-3-methyl-5-hydroxy-6-metoxy-1,4-benzoquinol methylase
VLCGAVGSHGVVEFVRAERHEVRQCDTCGHRFLDGWEHGYDVALYDYYAPRIGLSKDVLYDPLTSERLRASLERLHPAPRGRRLLDIGCGEGQLVDAALRVGFDARGIDVAEPAIDICRSFGLPCATEDLYSPELDAERFDVITLVETIEHVPDPVRMLRRARELLVDGGVVWLTTPNFASLGRRLLGERWPVLSPEHLSYFTGASLRETARRAGFGSRTLRSRTLSAAAVRALLRRPDPVEDETATGSHVSAGFAAAQDLRLRLESSAVLRGGMAAVNAALSVSRLGETLVAELR